VSPSHSHLATEFRVQRLAQHGERPEALDPPQAWLDIQEGRSEPTLCLVRGAPAIDFIGTLPEKRIERLQAVGGASGSRRAEGTGPSGAASGPPRTPRRDS